MYYAFLYHVLTNQSYHTLNQYSFTCSNQKLDCPSHIILKILKSTDVIITCYQVSLMTTIEETALRLKKRIGSNETEIILKNKIKQYV